MPRIVYAQYTNPANYPPLVHSSRILAELGWDVLLLGTAAHGTGGLAMDPHPAIRVELMPYHGPGLAQKAHYVQYAAWVLRQLAGWRADWCYASDLWSCPVGLAAAQIGISVIYHEHDDHAFIKSMTARAALGARAALAGRARLCVFPNEVRRERFAARNPDARTATVWNCPALSEVGPRRGPPTSDSFTLYYHGSIVPDRVPRALIEALARLPDTVRLRLGGYETIGSRGYSGELMELARSLGLARRIERQPLVERGRLWPQIDEADLGITLVPLKSDDPNLEAMVGASNKAFEYLARGLALLLPERTDWRNVFGEYGVTCNPEDAESIANAIRSLVNDRRAARDLGEAGRQRIAAEWNYERQFEPVLHVLHD